MATPSVSCVVWEWHRDDGGFSPYPPETSAQIEASYGRHDSQFHMVDYSITFSSMKQRKNISGYERSVQRTPIQLPSSPDITAYWTWNELGSSFALYSTQAIVDIELAYQQSLSQVDLLTCISRLPYTIDFIASEQIRHHYGTRRRILRHPLSLSLQHYLQVHGTPSVGPRIVAGTAASKSASGGTKSNPGSAATGATSLPGLPLRSSPRLLTVAKSSPTKRRRTGKAGGRKGKGAAPRGAAAKEAGTSRSATAGQPDSGITPYTQKVKTLKTEDDGPCPICMNQLSERSGFEEDEAPQPAIPYAPPLNLYKLKKCEHMMHRACLLMYLNSSGSKSKSGFQCPTCKKVYGVRTGDMPNGTMTLRNQKASLPGHEGCGTIEITYNFQAGVHNGRRYSTNGFPRVCYLPNSPNGQKILRLLRVAWERKLTFTIGTSVTTGATDTLVWNEIHHKTESRSNHSGHGYPDPGYLDRVLLELASQGVAEEEEKEEEEDEEEEETSIPSDSDSDSDDP